MLTLPVNREHIYPYQEDIYRRYLPKFAINKALKVPWRVDKSPSLVLYYSDDGILKWEDKSKQEYGDCISFVAKYESIKYGEAMNRITTTELKPNNHTNNINIISYHIQYNDFTTSDLQYWNSYGIKLPTLIKYGVRPIQRLNQYIDSKLYDAWNYSINNPIYSYNFESGTLFYRPFSKNSWKWKRHGNLYILGNSNINRDLNTLVITKGYKDVMLLHELGINAICAAGESQKIKKQDINNYKDQFSNIIALFDNDSCGLNQLQYYSKTYNVRTFTIEESINNRRLDISDYYFYYGERKTKDLLTKIINKQ